jgi:cytochrome c biogenesis protein CcdA
MIIALMFIAAGAVAGTIYIALTKDWSKWCAGIILALFLLVIMWAWTDSYGNDAQEKFVCDRAHGVLLKTVNGERICADRDSIHVLERDNKHFDPGGYNG